MGIILRKSTDTRHPVQLTGLLPAINRSKLSETNRQVTIAVTLAGKNLDVMRTVHRLQKIAFDISIRELVTQLATRTSLTGKVCQEITLDQRWILALRVIWEVAAGLVQLQTPDMRCVDLVIALLTQLIRDKALQLSSDCASSRCPQDETLTNGFINMEELQMLTDNTVVAALRFLELDEISVQLILSFKCNAINTGQLLILSLATPIGTSNGHQLECTDFSRRFNVRSLAQVDEVALLIKGNLCFVRKVIDQADLEGLRKLLATLAGFLTWLRPAHHRQVSLDNLTHPGFDRRKVIL